MHPGKAFLGGWAILFLAASAAAQQPRQVPRENVRFKGTIKALARGLLQVEDEEGAQRLVAIEASPQDISFAGLAGPSFLRPGMLVQFSAVVDKKGEATRPITEVKVVTPRPGLELGARSEGGLEGKALFATDEEEKQGGGTDKPFFISGIVRAVKEGKILVVVAGAAVRGELADNCTVSVNIADYSLARSGDAVEIAGWHVAGQPQQVRAQQVSIVASKPLDSVDEAEKQKGPRRRATRKNGGPSDEPAPAARPSGERESRGEKPESKSKG
ncbi:MAG: hypothetical protein AB7O38_28100 [Pirellulaceae bacterium]